MVGSVIPKSTGRGFWRTYHAILQLWDEERLEMHRLGYTERSIEVRQFRLNNYKHLLMFANLYPCTRCDRDFTNILKHDNDNSSGLTVKKFYVPTRTDVYPPEIVDMSAPIPENEITLFPYYSTYFEYGCDKHRQVTEKINREQKANDRLLSTFFFPYFGLPFGILDSYAVLFVTTVSIENDQMWVDVRDPYILKVSLQSFQISSYAREDGHWGFSSETNIDAQPGDISFTTQLDAFFRYFFGLFSAYVDRTIEHKYKSILNFLAPSDKRSYAWCLTNKRFQLSIYKLRCLLIPSSLEPNRLGTFKREKERYEKNGWIYKTELEIDEVRRKKSPSNTPGDPSGSDDIKKEPTSYFTTVGTVLSVLGLIGAGIGIFIVYHSKTIARIMDSSASESVQTTHLSETETLKNEKNDTSIADTDSKPSVKQPSVTQTSIGQPSVEHSDNKRSFL